MHGCSSLPPDLQRVASELVVELVRSGLPRSLIHSARDLFLNNTALCKQDRDNELR